MEARTYAGLDRTLTNVVLRGGELFILPRVPGSMVAARNGSDSVVAFIASSNVSDTVERRSLSFSSMYEVCLSSWLR